MTTVIVEAIYQDGVLKPLQALDIPDNACVRVQVMPFPAEEDMGPLAGAFPELAALTEEDMKWAKGLWEKGLEEKDICLRLKPSL